MHFSHLAALDLRNVVVSALVLMAFAGLLMLLSPQHFALASRGGSQRIDVRNFFGSVESQYGVNRKALWSGRLFGLALLVGSLLLAWVYWTHVLGLPLPLPL